jgi:tyrosine-protein phosphatase YwqE
MHLFSCTRSSLLQVAGYIPVLAHPERYLFYHNNFNEYVKLKEPVVYFSSIYCQLWLLRTSNYKIAEQLLAKGMYSYVGSDVHHNNHAANKK